MSIAKERSLARIKRKVRVRQKVRGTAERPRLCVFRSAKHIYAQIIEDTNGTTLVSAGSVNEGIVEAGTSSGNIESAKAVGRAIAKMALEKNIKQVVFDRNGFLYHGRVKALAEAARETGLSF
ncbi:50S ribosomal protein L18 [Desulfuromonas sp. AOP6]|uniref:50S ribosomal protein L18 n=1 Tax=Desulfuromonas sp. AOP6 TaxID=1566351 RepID=UPI0012865A28|nr:50S ribosomal protein L18 [Desulfuromonas sp. AOP6]BCA80449.1 50S ribosomal protein L18 [Desulfuromonas sp. AOP6]